MTEPLFFWLGSDAEHEPLTIRDIQHTVADYYRIPIQAMRSETKGTIDQVWPRQVAMYLSREFTGQSLPSIAKRFNRKDHTTVINAVRRVGQRLAGNDELLADVSAIRSRLSRLMPHAQQQADYAARIEVRG